MKNCAPSKAYRWVPCIASPQYDRDHTPVLGGNVETPASPQAIEGRAAHWVAKCVLYGDAHTAEDLCGRTSPDGHLVTMDMCEHVQGYVDLVRSLGVLFSVEKAVQVGPFIFGRVDAEVSVHQDYTLLIPDLKYGFEIVEPFMNYALLIYARACLNDNHQIIKLIIHQPRPHHHLGPTREWSISREQLIYWSDYAMQRAEAAQQHDAQATPGDYCLGCPGSAQCHALAATVYRDHQAINTRGRSPMSNAELGRELAFLEAAAEFTEARLNGIKSEVDARMLAGQFVPGWMFEDKYARDRQFTVEPQIIGMLTGTKMTREVPVTPSQLEKEGVPKAIMDKISKRPKVGRKLVRATPDKIARIFNAAK